MADKEKKKIEDNEKKYQITAKVVIEVLGTPKDHVEQTLKQIVELLKKEDRKYELLVAQVYEAKETKKDWWNSFVDLEIRFKDLDTLVIFCFDYVPSSIDIVEPQSVELKASVMNGLLNDLLTQIHKYDMAYKKLRAENLLFKRDQQEKKKDN